MIGALVFILFCLAIGVLLLIPKKSKERIRLIAYAALVGFLLFFVISVSFRLNDWYHRRYLGNIDANTEFMSSSSSYPVQEQQAFKMLTDRYKDPNNLRLFQKSVTRVSDNEYDVEFIYSKVNKAGSYKAKCTIIGSLGKLQYFDRRLNDYEEYLMDSSNNEGLREGLKTILEDSAKLSLDSAAKEMIRKKIKSKEIQ